MNRTIIAIAVLFLFNQAYGEVLTKDQTFVLVANLIVPKVQRYAKPATTTFDLVVIDDPKLCEELSTKYQSLGQWLKFGPKSAVLFKDGVYVHKSIPGKVHVNRFKVTEHGKGICVVEWSRTASSLSSEVITVTLQREKKYWIITEKKTKSVA